MPEKPGWLCKFKPYLPPAALGLTDVGHAAFSIFFASQVCESQFFAALDRCG
jgi:hypothetical protein